MATTVLSPPGPYVNATIPELVETLKHSDANVRLSAAEELAERGPDAKAAVPALVAALKDSDAGVRPDET